MQTTRFWAAILLVALIASPLFAANKALQSMPITVPKETDNALDVVKTYLTPRAQNGMAKIWVFFTDKSVFSDEQFARAAASVQLTDKALIRRAKVGLDKITFGDLPVYRDYIDQVSALGGKLRRVSRWLNAASFEAPLAAIDDINRLPFVAKVRPVAVFVRDPETVEPPSEAPTYAPGEGHSLSYGISFGQLNQINVPAVHDQGYNGSGVIVAMLDTGYRKDHDAFAAAFGSGRVLAEHDFIFNDGNTQNEAQDSYDQHNHGTYTWSTLGGAVPGALYGPAYGASFVLAKTEYVPTETQVEEDNWAAAVEWADSLGAQVISSSLGYSDWYTYSNFDGQTAVTTIAANLATSYGIVVCNSMGNEGPDPGTLTAPADAFEILSCGAVNSGGNIASFSSHGPTYDGRMKPEVCAQGVSTYCASPGSTTGFTYVGGTSLSTPLIGGCAAVLLSARPSLTPQMVRMALMQTASRADNPDNTYGWGIANLAAALNWGAKTGADIKVGPAPLTVAFIDSSYVPATAWSWSFGDGDNSTLQNPVHTYTDPGTYDVSLTITSDGRPLNDTKPDYIIALADTMTFKGDSVYAGQKVTVSVNVTNTQTLSSILVPFDYSTGMVIALDSFSVAGTRTTGWTSLLVGGSPAQRKLAIFLQHNGTPLPAGTGPVLRFYFSSDPYAFGKWSATADTSTIGGESLRLSAADFSYVPVFHPGVVVIRDVIRGDANNDGALNIADPVAVINYLFKSGPGPVSIEAGDANLDTLVDLADAVYVINYIFKGGPAPNDF